MLDESSSGGRRTLLIKRFALVVTKDVRFDLREVAHRFLCDGEQRTRRSATKLVN
ncbi:MAG: hypothetical protein ACTS6H_01540 [Candidatus Hodgkinia cicadicola]